MSSPRSVSLALAAPLLLALSGGHARAVDPPPARGPAIAALVERARARGADVVLLPEYASYFVDPFDETLAAHAEPVVGPFTEALRELAAVHDVVIVAGLLESASEGRVRNTVVAVGADGVLAASRKLHLYDAFGQRESDWIAAGDIAEPETFVRRGIKLSFEK